MDLLIVGRGGGSAEDLWCFNNEQVVKAIFNSHLPIVSAVGHEVDTTLADYAADLRAATPSAAAEMISNNQQELINYFAKLNQRLVFAINALTQYKFEKHQVIYHRLSRCHPEQKLIMQQQKTDELQQRLVNALARQHNDQSISFNNLQHRLNQCSPLILAKQQQQQLAQLSVRLKQAMTTFTNHRKQSFAHLTEQLHVVSPLATIARGYSITTDEKNQVINSVSQVSNNDTVKIQVNDGQLTAIISDIKKK